MRNLLWNCSLASGVACVVLFFLCLGDLVGMLRWKYLLFSLRCRHRKRPSSVRLVFTLEGQERTVISVKDSQTLKINVTAEDIKHHTGAALDSAPSWSVADPSILSVAPTADGLSAIVTPTDNLGTTQVIVQATAGGKAITGSLDVVVTPGDAVGLVLQPEAPVDV